MSIHRTCFSLVLIGVLLAGVRAPAGDEPVLRSMTTEQLEAILGEMKIDAKKSENAEIPGLFYYDFKRGGFGVRLTYYHGKDLMLDSQFHKGVPLETLNDWNKKAKYSRASLHQDKVGPFITLEYNLDLTGGVTRGTIRQFIAQFDRESASFDRFLASAANPAPKLNQLVTDALLEQVLGGLKVQYKKRSEADGETTYDFTLDDIHLRLFNYGGRDLMITAVFRKAPLEAINKYNVERKFVRAVSYTTGSERTVLESNLDCAAGVTEEMVRYFITVFVPEAKHFAGYLAN